MASVSAATDPVNYDPESSYHASALHEAHQRLAAVATQILASRGTTDPDLKKMAQASADHSGQHVVKIAKWMAKRWASSSGSNPK